MLGERLNITSINLLISDPLVDPPVKSGGKVAVVPVGLSCKVEPKSVETLEYVVGLAILEWLADSITLIMLVSEVTAMRVLVVTVVAEVPELLLFRTKVAVDVVLVDEVSSTGRKDRVTVVAISCCVATEVLFWAMTVGLIVEDVVVVVAVELLGAVLDCVTTMLEVSVLAVEFDIVA